MTKILSIDQSLTNFAHVVWTDTSKEFIPVDWGVERTGSTGSKGAKKSTVCYYDTDHGQLKHLCDHFKALLVEHKPDKIVFEALSFGSNGTAARVLAALYYMCYDIAVHSCGYSPEDFYSLAPTTVKAHARKSLPLEEQTYKKNGKQLKVTMNKAMMIKAAEENYSYVLKGYTQSGKISGKGDLADALFIGECLITKLEK